MFHAFILSKIICPILTSKSTRSSFTQKEPHTMIRSNLVMRQLDKPQQDSSGTQRLLLKLRVSQYFCNPKVMEPY